MHIVRFEDLKVFIDLPPINAKAFNHEYLPKKYFQLYNVIF